MILKGPTVVHMLASCIIEAMYALSNSDPSRYLSTMPQCKAMVWLEGEADDRLALERDDKTSLYDHLDESTSYPSWLSLVSSVLSKKMAAAAPWKLSSTSPAILCPWLPLARRVPFPSACSCKLV